MATIDQILGQLPYENKPRVRQDVVALCANTRSLVPRMGSLVHNNGMTATLISLQGTVPIYYQGSQYNIPIDIYLYEAYPRICPKIFVRPTSNMMVKPNHRSVDANGVVYLPYLNQWNFGANLVDLVNQVSSVFSSDPPLFSRPAGRAQTQPPMSTYSSQASPPSSSAQAGVPGPGPPGYSYNPPTQPLPAQAQQPPPYTQYAGYAQAPQNQRKTRQQLEEEVAEKLKRELKDFYTKLQGELDSEFRTQAELSEHSNRVRETIQRLDSVRTALQDASTKIQLQTFELQEWSERMSKEAAAGKDAAESKLAAYDDLSAQIVRLTAEQQAIDDTIYYLERSLARAQNVEVDMGTFLKEVRRLARQQFLCKIHLMKINASVAQAARVGSLK